MNLKSVATTFGATTLVAAGISAVSTQACAQWYVSGSGGMGLQSDSDFTDTAGAASATGSASFDTGFTFGAALGYAFGPLRVEGEISYRQNDLDDVTVNSITLGGTPLFSGAATLSADGDASALGFMVNGWYDFNTNSNWVPFIGGGIGVANLNLSVDKLAGTTVSFDESDTVFAYQFGAGIGYKVTPNVMVSLAYRFFGTSDPTFESSTDKIEAEYINHSVMLGVAGRF